MINKKSLGKLMLLGLTAASLSACGGGSTGPELTIWCPEMDNGIQSQIIAKFKEKYTDYAGYNIHVLGNMAEGDTQGNLHKDPNAAADVICMVDDNIRKAVDSKELLALDDALKTSIAATDGQEAVDAASISDKLYGYPYRADNAPLLIYDTAKYSADDVSTFDKLFAKTATLAKVGEKTPQVALDIGNGWYNPFIFWMAGGEFHLNAKAEIECNFTTKSECATAAQAVYDFYGAHSTNWNVTSDNGIIEKGLADGTIPAAFIWNDLAAIRAALPAGSSVKVASWPTFTFNGAQVKLKHFKGYKDYVIKAAIDDDRVEIAKAFCSFASSEEVQNMRAADAKLQYGPSNLNSKKTETAKALEWGSVIMADDTAGLTISQALTTNSDFWDPMGTFGGLIKSQTNWGEFGKASRAIENILSQQGWVKPA